MRFLALANLDRPTLPLGKLDDSRLSLIVACGGVTEPAFDALCRASTLPIFAVRGSRDEANWPRGVTDLHLRVVEYGGIRFGGLHGSTTVEPFRHLDYDDERLSKLFRYFPAVDVFVAHLAPAPLEPKTDAEAQPTNSTQSVEPTSPPPASTSAPTNDNDNDNDNAADAPMAVAAFGQYIDRVRPKMFLHSGPHDARATMIGDTRVIPVHGSATIDL